MMHPSMGMGGMMGDQPSMMMNHGMCMMQYGVMMDRSMMDDVMGMMGWH